MIDAEVFLKLLREEYSSGATYQELADKCGLSYAYIHGLLSGKHPADGISIRKINRMFPNAILTVGNRNIGNSNTITNSRVQSDNNFLSKSGVEDYRKRLIDAIISSEKISDEERGRFLRIVKEVPYE